MNLKALLKSYLLILMIREMAQLLTLITKEITRKTPDVVKICPVCQETSDECGFCGCDPPFDLDKIPLPRLRSIAHDILKEARAYYGRPKEYGGVCEKP